MRTERESNDLLDEMLAILNNFADKCRFSFSLFVRPVQRLRSTLEAGMLAYISELVQIGFGTVTAFCRSACNHNSHDLAEHRRQYVTTARFLNDP